MRNIYESNPELNRIIGGLETYTSTRNFFNKDFDLFVEVGNQLEELSEYFKANRDYKRIDALCDVSVFGINSLRYLEQKALRNGLTVCLDIKHQSWMRKTVDINPFALIGVLASFEDFNNWDCKVISLIHYSKVLIERAGYDYHSCMMETIKEISSRVQDPCQETSWRLNGVKGKWQKDKKQDPSTLYPADYDSCKIELPFKLVTDIEDTNNDFLCNMCNDSKRVVDYNSDNLTVIDCPNCMDKEI